MESAEQIQAQKIIVIHPGSLNLRIGRASDLNPHTILHAVARRKGPKGKAYRDTILPKLLSKTPELLQELEDCRLAVSHTLQSCLQSDGRRRYATPPQQISAFNRRSTPDVLNEPSSDWYEPKGDTVFGNSVLNLDPNGDFNLHFPMRRGELNIHTDIGGSLTSVLTDLQAIWEYVLSAVMEIKISDLSAYKAVLVIPDIYNRAYLRELMTLLLCRMGFKSCFLVQDHVAATFGAGLGYACVVDVGDQKTSVSCVEDAISHPNTRVRLEYGGGDVTQTFYWLLQKCAFPYKNCKVNLPQDAMLLKKLKEEFCHVNLDVCGSEEKHFDAIQPGRASAHRYTLQVGDEAIVAPLSLFHTELLNVTGTTKLAKTQIPWTKQYDPEDCFDAEYLKETSRRSAKEQLEQSTPEFLHNENPDEEIVVDEDKENNKQIEKEFVVPGGQIIGLDQAVLQSIERCPNEELKRKMYGCILVVGGGMKFQGIGKWLQNRVALQIPYLYRSEQLDIVTSPKDMDPAMTAWKGASVLSCLESASELWITSQEWQKYGVKILREKAPFVW
ncbi:actin-related protein 8 [Lutzomyia longipalpis]|uniref:actin-related protein 8 n=1 Tax=Lutzomyia longipalpis TaxID=7200 RepID=UPI002483413E|nr:actin-related protein 8 [Lutzomyia longipalpis]